MRIAVIRGLHRLHDGVENLLRRLLDKESEFSGLLKVGRTQLQDGLPVTLGQVFGAWAGAES